MLLIPKKIFTVTCLLLLAFPTFAASAEDDENGAINDAWLEGKLDTVIVLNRHLNPFKLETEVTNRTAIITGTVDSQIERNLVTDLAANIDGITEVDNRVLVVAPTEDQGLDVLDRLTDAAITTAISTKLLFNSEIDSGEIEVDTEAKVVTLSGTVDNETERELVAQVARNTFDVVSVNNNLTLK